MSELLIAVNRPEEILPEYRGGPIEDILSYHNLKAPLEPCTKAKLLMGTCMDNRISLRFPENFAYVIRTGGANLKELEFQISYVVAVAGVRAVCLIGHDQCAMCSPREKRREFVEGLVKSGSRDRRKAEDHFDSQVSRFEVGDPAQFTRAQALHLKEKYPGVTVAPLMYLLKDRRLYQIDQAR